MLATFFVMLAIFSMYYIGHQHLKLVTNTFGLQHPVSNIGFTKDLLPLLVIISGAIYSGVPQNVHVL